MCYHLIFVRILDQELYLLFLLSVCTVDLISALKTITVFPMLPSANENYKRELNPMLRPSYLYLSRSAFLVSYTNRNTHLFNVKYVFKFCKYGLTM